MSSRRASAPLAASGVVLALLALAALARPREVPADDSPPAAVAAVDAGLDSGLDSEARLRLLAEQPLDLNTAGRADFELLPRIGPALAGRIVEDRERAGSFASVDDLVRVRGIGPRTLDRLRPLICVEPPPDVPDR